VRAVTRPRLLPLAASLILASCGGAAASGVGTSHGRPREIPVELSLRTTGGAIVEVADQRGAPCLLFVASTYDGISQAAIREVSTFARTHLDTVVLGIIAQPDAATFAALYEETFEPPYTVVYEAGETIQQGTSDLGPFDAVPAFYMLDARGLLADAHVGWITTDRLNQMHAEAVGRGGIVAAPAEPAPDEPSAAPAAP
jgi:hypothetical protein